jgi:diguanylate cyclase (GGDEF)-like protein
MDERPGKDLALSGDERLTIDPLTGLRNEQLFRLRLPHEFARARERETNAALLLVKLDGIIALNARQGRMRGDEALRVVAQVLEARRSAPGRQGQLAFRLGGPVFGYYLPACGSPEAKAMAEEIRQAVMEPELYLEPITVSIGVVNLYEFFLADGTTEEIALQIEQTALHRLSIAERQGANTVCDTSEPAEASAAARPAVLVVEPDPASIELLLHALKTAGFAVEVREDGESALALVQASPPGVIICEAMVPRLDGFTVRERLRANALWNAIPFILVSHRKNEELIRKAVQAGIRHYFRKPLSIVEVVGLVGNLVRSGPR